MADSKFKGPEEATSEAEDLQQRKAIAPDQNEISIIQVGDQIDFSAVQRNPNSLELAKVKSARLGTDPELAFGDLAHSKRVRSIKANVAPPAPLKLRFSATTSIPVVAGTGGQSSSVGTQSSSPSQVPARPRPRSALRPKGTSSSQPHSSSASIFGSCFGKCPGAQSSSSSGSKGRSPSQSSSPRKQSSPPKVGIEPVSDPTKRVVSLVEGLNIAPGLDLTTSTPATAPAALVAADAREANALSALPAISRSPSCRCSINTVQAETAEKTEQSLQLGPGNPGSMNKPENDIAGISSAQQVLNAQTEELIAAVKRADESEPHEASPEPSPRAPVEPSPESRQAATGLSPIRGLRPSLTQGRPRRSDTAGGGDQSPRAPKSSFQDRSSTPFDYNYIRCSPPHFDRRRSAEPQATTSGVGRLFDSILGPGDYYSQERALSRSPSNRFHRKQKKKDATSASTSSAWAEQVRGWSDDDPPQGPRNPSASTSSGWAEQVRGWSDDDPPQGPRNPSASTSSGWAEQVRGWSDDDLSQGPRNPPPKNSLQTTNVSRDAQQTYVDPANPPGERSNRRDRQKYADLASNLPETSNRDKEAVHENLGSNPTGSRNQANEYDTFVDGRAALYMINPEQRDSDLSASDVRWKKKDPYREVVERPKDPRRRGQPDPSFNPRPGDIIIRARKRAGLRLTDFYYYDNENYMEEGDQILRAKFEYLPPMDKMYLWCRLYVYRADGTYTYLDQTSETVANFGTADPADVKTFRKPSGFK